MDPISIINIDEETDTIKKITNDLLVINGNSFNFLSDVLRASINSTTEVTHLWFFNIKPISYAHLLSIEEKKKADLFKRNVDRDRYVFSRGLLRVLLGYYLKLDAEGIHIKENSSGKPELYRGAGPSFNVSHSNDMVVYAFSNLKKVGIDIEYIRDVNNIDRIAVGLLSMCDYNWFKSLPLKEKRMIFFKLWTAREACFKAFNGELTNYSIFFGDDGSVNIKAIQGVESSPVKLFHFKIFDDYLTTLAV